MEALAQLAAPERKAGFLWKQGRGRNFSPYKPWARRMFDLDPGASSLTYSWEGSVKGRIALDNDSSAERIPGSGREAHAFVVRGAGGESLRCAGADAADADAWVSAVNRAVLGPFIVEAKAVMAAREVAAAKERRKAEAEARAAKTKEAAIAAKARKLDPVPTKAKIRKAAGRAFAAGSARAKPRGTAA